MTRAENIIKNAKFKHEHRSAMSNSAGCDLNNNCTNSKLHVMCHNPKFNCQKQITFIPKQNKLESGSIQSKLQKLHDMCDNPNYNCQKQITFTPKQYML